MVGYLNRNICPAGWTAANDPGSTPDPQSMLVRGAGGKSGALGVVQDEAIRSIAGQVASHNMPFHTLF